MEPNKSNYTKIYSKIFRNPKLENTKKLYLLFLGNILERRESEYFLEY